MPGDAEGRAAGGPSPPPGKGLESEAQPSPVVEPHAWAKELGRFGLGLLGCWGGALLTWRVQALAIGGVVLLCAGLYLLVKGAFGAVHQAQRFGEKAAALLLIVLAALHVLALLPALVAGVVAWMLSGRADRLRAGIEIFSAEEPSPLSE